MAQLGFGSHDRLVVRLEILTGRKNYNWLLVIISSEEYVHTDIIACLPSPQQYDFIDLKLSTMFSLILTELKFCYLCLVRSWMIYIIKLDNI